MWIPNVIEPPKDCDNQREFFRANHLDYDKMMAERRQEYDNYMALYDYWKWEEKGVTYFTRTNKGIIPTHNPMEGGQDGNATVR